MPFLPYIDSALSIWRAVFTVPLVASSAFGVSLPYNAQHTREPVSRLHVFIHVPKCAGTSFSRAMRPVSNSTQWWPTDILASGCAPRQEGEPKQEDIVYTSHCTLSELETCIQSGNACYWDDPQGKMAQGVRCPEPVPVSVPLRFVMLIRLPVQRVLSEYYYFKMLLTQSIHSNPRLMIKTIGARLWTPSVREVALTGSLLDWVRAPGNRAHNAITKAVINGEAGFQAPVLRQTPGHVPSCAVFDDEAYLSHWQKYYGSPSGSDVEAVINSDQRLLSAAIATFEERFDFVGLVEHFDESVARLSRLLGIAPAPSDTATQFHPSNTPADASIDPDVVEEIRARNTLDIDLYHAVLHSRFWKDSAASLNAFDALQVKKLTWQSVLNGDREGGVFDSSVIFSTTPVL